MTAQTSPRASAHTQSRTASNEPGQPGHDRVPWFLCQDFLGHATHANLLEHYLALDPLNDYRLVRFAVASVESQVARRMLRLGGARFPFRPVSRRGLDLWPARTFLVQGFLARRAMASLAPTAPSLVYMHSHSAGLAATNVPRPVPVVLSLDSTLAAEARMLGRQSGGLDRLALAMEQRILERADLIVSFSTWAHDSVVNDNGIDPDKVITIPNGVMRMPAPAEAAGLDIPDDLPVVGFVGNDLERKGGNLLLEAHQRHLAGRVRLVMVTRQPIDTRRLRNVTVLCNLDRTTLLESVMPRFTLLAHPATVDWSPYAVVEALAGGLPVVATRVGALPEMVSDGENGYLLANPEPQSLAEAIEAIVDHPLRASTMGRASRDRFECIYDADLTYPELLRSIRQIAAGTTPGDEPLS